MKHYFVLIGNFGSGKSEISLNMVFNAAKSDEKAVLVDLDIINPYFRSSERNLELSKAGVKLYYPIFALSTVDVPSLPPDIYSVFVGEFDKVVFDVGGDPAGATALGQYKPNFEDIPPENLHVMYVVNARRPLSETPELITEMLEKIKYRSRLNISGLINNTNLSIESSADDLMFGYEILKEVSEATGIPVMYTAGVKEALDGFMEMAEERNLNKAYIGDPYEINIFMHRDWDRFTLLGV